MATEAFQNMADRPWIHGQILTDITAKEYSQGRKSRVYTGKQTWRQKIMLAA